MQTHLLRCSVASFVAFVLSIGAVEVVSAQSILPKLPVATPAEQAYASGLKALNQNDLAGAEVAFKTALNSDSTALGAALGLADVAIRRGKTDEVKGWLERAAKIKPGSVEVETSWARYYYAIGDYQVAEARLKKAAQMDANAFIPRVDLADLYMTKLGKPQLAVAAYRDAIRTSPLHAGARFGLGVALAATGDNAGALVELEQSARFEPDNPLPLRAIGQVHVAERRFDAGIQAFTKAISLRPTFAALYTDRAEAHGRSGDDVKALSDYDQALKHAPKFAEAHVGKGMVYQRQGKADDAQAAYLAAVAIDGKNAVAYNNLAWLAAERKTRLDDALAWATKATQIAPNAGPYFDTLGWVHRARNEHDRATIALEKAVKLSPTYAEAHYHLGVVHSEGNRRPLAVAAFKKALALDPDAVFAADVKRRLAALGG